jgi:hypothetical protein
MNCPLAVRRYGRLALNGGCVQVDESSLPRLGDGWKLVADIPVPEASAAILCINEFACHAWPSGIPDIGFAIDV